MDIAVIGTGYVGLVTGAVFAELGNHVICADKDAARVERLKALKMPFFEPGLEEMVTRNQEDGRIEFTADVPHAIKECEIIFIAVGTPPKEQGETDLSQVEAAAAEIGKNYNNYKIIVNKSTVPVGTGDLVKEIINRHKPPELDIHVVSNPEFLSEGTAVADAMSPDRIVIGAPNKQVAMKLIELYSTLEKPMIITSVRSAEMIKYASNGFLATKISFINSVANLCEVVGADVDEVRRGMGLDVKPNTDDIRDASAIAIIRLLIERGARAQAYDPMAMDNVRRLGLDMQFCEDEYDAAAGAHAVLVLTEWNRFRQLNFSRLKRVMAGRHLFDGRNIYDPAVVHRYGLVYYGIGRVTSNGEEKT